MHDEHLPQVAQETAVAIGNQFVGATFKETMEIAKYFSESDLIPTHFQRKPANVFIALELAARMQMSPFMVMQSLYVVYGRPGLEGKFLIAMANRAGWKLQFDIERDSSGKIIACTAFSEKGGVHTRGPKITEAMVKAEGWSRPKKAKNGNQEYTIPSKWETMPDLMYRYRAGAYFVNTVCPELKMGMSTVEELEDIIDIEPVTHVPLRNIIAPAPLEEEKPSPEVLQAVACGLFDKRLDEYQGEHKDKVSAYLEAAAKHNKSTIEATKEQAANNWTSFVKMFEKWAAKEAQKETAKQDKAEKAPAQAPASDNGPVRSVTDEQIDAIKDLCNVKIYPIEDLLREQKVSSLAELDWNSANKIIDILASY